MNKRSYGTFRLPDSLHSSPKQRIFTSNHGNESVTSLVFDRCNNGATPKSSSTRSTNRISSEAVGLTTLASTPVPTSTRNNSALAGPNLKFPTMMTLQPDITSHKTKTVAFEIGRISHYHNPAEREAIDLTVTLQFDNPTLDRRVFTFALECRNGLSGRDTIFIKKSATSKHTFELNGRIYTMRLLGFGNDPLNLTTSTQMQLSTHNTEKLFAEFVDVTDPSHPASAALAAPFTILGLIAVQKPQ